MLSFKKTRRSPPIRIRNDDRPVTTGELAGLVSKPRCKIRTRARRIKPGRVRTDLATLHPSVFELIVAVGLTSVWPFIEMGQSHTPHLAGMWAARGRAEVPTPPSPYRISWVRISWRNQGLAQSESGEVFALLATNPRIDAPVQLDVRPVCSNATPAPCARWMRDSVRTPEKRISTRRFLHIAGRFPGLVSMRVPTVGLWSRNRRPGNQYLQTSQTLETGRSDRAHRAPLRSTGRLFGGATPVGLTPTTTVVRASQPFRSIGMKTLLPVAQHLLR